MNSENIIIAKVRDSTYKLEGSDENIAAFLAKNPLENITLCKPSGEAISSTLGFFIDKCSDYSYVQRLQPIITSYQFNPISIPTVKLAQEQHRSFDSRKI